MAEETFLDWYVCTVESDRESEDGTQKKVKEKYLVTAVSLSDAEASLVKEIPGYQSTTQAAKEHVSEIFGSDEDDGEWYKATVSFITISEKTGKERRTKHAMYIRATSFEDALSTFNTGMRGTMADYELESVAKAHLAEIFK